MKRLRQLIFITIFMSYLSSCTYEKEIKAPDPLAGCNTADMKYSVDITNILNVRGCTSCHSGNFASGNPEVHLDSHAGVEAVISDNRLLRAINWTGPAHTHMPQGGNKLPDCEIAKITAWINQGHLNN